MPGSVPIQQQQQQQQQQTQRPKTSYASSSSTCQQFSSVQEECPKQVLAFKNNIINTTLDAVAYRLQSVADQTWDATKVVASKIHAFGDLMAGKEEFDVPFDKEYIELGVVIASRSPALYRKMVSVGETLSKTPISQRGEVYLKSFI
jgi:hypothetical protein